MVRQTALLFITRDTSCWRVKVKSPKRKMALLSLALCAAAVNVPFADGHGILTTPAPRDGTTIAGGNKGNVGPCGDNTATAGTATATLAAGAQTTVRWALNAAHNGPCEVKIAATDGALAGAATLANVGACNGQDSVDITVPAGMAAGNAVLQWNWSGDAPYFDLRGHHHRGGRRRYVAVRRGRWRVGRDGGRLRPGR